MDLKVTKRKFGPRCHLEVVVLMDLSSPFFIMEESLNGASKHCCKAKELKNRKHKWLTDHANANEISLW